ncbi:GNAT family N-acetyltransferase [bacterium]|nr:MAG: GNAT family N-acetyltransferase [bacterium]
MAEYRSIRTEEWPDALVMWNEVFGAGSWLFHSLHKGTAGRKWDHCAVAVEDGEIVSAVDVFLRERRDVDGRPVKVGCIGSVATYPEHRRKGHSIHLLQMALETMRREGCEWSFLFTGVPEHYARLGWKTAPLRSRLGSWSDRPSIGGTRQASRYEWEELAPIYDATVGRLPLAAIRDPLSWKYAQGARIARPEQVLLRIGDSYALAKIDGETELQELAGSNPEELDALLSAVREGSSSQDIRLGIARTPENEAAIERWMVDVREETSLWAMARPIERGEVNVEALFAHPLAHHHALDNF